jgi:hypothetical protein
MPDWFYRTVSRPVLFRLPPRTARNFTLRFLGTLARLPLGPGVIDFLGHMAPPRQLRQTFLDINFPSTVGLGSWLDRDAVAMPALARFGFGFSTSAPVMVQPTSASTPLEVEPAQGSILSFGRQRQRRRAGAHAAHHRSVSFETADCCCAGLPGRNRFSPRTQQCRQLIEQLAPHVTLFSLATLPLAASDGWDAHGWKTHVEEVVEAARTASTPRTLLLRVPC